MGYYVVMQGAKCSLYNKTGELASFPPKFLKGFVMVSSFKKMWSLSINLDVYIKLIENQT